MLVERPEDPMKKEQDKRKADMSRNGTRPISTVGAGRAGALMAFTSGAQVMSGR